MKCIAILTGIFVLLFKSNGERIHAQEAREKNYAQTLVDRALARHPEVATLAMHVRPPKSTDNVIIASNFGRIGKKADDDDLAVIKTGQPKSEVGKNGDRFSVELPLQDVSGDTVGALAVAFPYKACDDKAEFLKLAERGGEGVGSAVNKTGHFVETLPLYEDPPDTHPQKHT